MILITGGNGYIGGHLAMHLLNIKKDFVILDWDENNKKVLEDAGAIIAQGDCTEHDDVMRVFEKYKIGSVIHLAAFKDVGASVKAPLGFYYNNINSLTTVLLAMKTHNIDKIVFSSTCAVYGECEGGDEATPYNPKSPYALSKKICEEILIGSEMDYSILRYFNPVGEYHGLRDFSFDSLQNKMKLGSAGGFHIYGNDYDTPDGTPVRDFIDIDDLIRAHLMALGWKREIVNIGTGQPQSVLSVVKKNGIPYQFAPRRSGDIAKIWANVDKWNKLKKHGTRK